MGYCPFSNCGRDTARLYRDTAGHRRARQGATQPGLRAGARSSARATRCNNIATQRTALATWVCIATRFLCHDGGQRARVTQRSDTAPRATWR